MVDTHDSGLISPGQLAARFKSISHFDNLVVAVSGGSDSMALLHLVHLWLRGALQHMPTVSVVTVDHGLRKGSAEDAVFVGRACGALGFQHHTLHWAGDKPTSGLQEQARQARYDLLIGHAKELPGHSAILTAHTQDDQAETVLMRLGRGSGPDGLAAIPELAARDSVSIVRPLLDVSRSQLVAFLSELGQAWRDDPSNSMIDFERIRIRNARNARAELALADRALAQTAKRMQRARNSLRQVSDNLLSRAVDHQQLLQYGVFEWSRALLERYGSEIAIRCLRRIVRVIGGSHEHPNLSQVELLHEQMLDEDFRGTTLHGARLICDEANGQKKIYILRETGRAGLPIKELNPSDTIVWDGRFSVQNAPDLPPKLRLGPLSSRHLEQLDTFRPRGVSTSLANHIALTLPAVWQDDHVLGLPHLENCCPQISLDTTYMRKQLTC